MASDRDQARKLAVEYFKQLGENGETEVYLSPDSALGIRGLRVPRTEVAATAAAEDAAPAGLPSAAEDTAPAKTPSAAETPDHAEAEAGPSPEVVRVKLAFSTATTTGDMFAGTTGLESCSTLGDVEAASAGCEKCELAQGRTNVVFGVGNPNARLMFIGEAPGRDEDIQGIPFVGRAGQLLNKILEAAEIERDDVYIANIIKCRPPNNRTPLTNEIEACIPYLGRQVALIAPRIICTLGLPATQTLLGIRGSMGSLRGKMYVEGDVKVIPTYHPAAALRDPKYKRPIWDDFKLIKREYERA
jgi:DNA polymerase